MNNRGGFVLVIVLLAVSLLVGLVTMFVSEVYLEAGSSRAALDATQGSLFAAGGVSAAQQLLGQTLKNRTYTSLKDSWASPILIDDPLGQGKLRVSIEEENSKLNLNAIVFPNGRQNQAYYETGERLLRQFKLSPELLEAVADWIDEDETAHPGGAEADWYMAQKQPYRPRNKPLVTVEEIKRIKGFAPVFDRISPFVTVYGDQPAGSPAAPININTAPKELFLALDERISPSLADRIIAYRKDTPFKNPAELAQVAGMEQIATALLTRICTKGTVFRIRSDGLVNGVTRTVEAVVRVDGSTSSILYWREY